MGRLFCRLGLCACRRGQLIGKLLCEISLHKWRWQDTMSHSLYIRQVKRCEREGCTWEKHRVIYPKG